jgi:DNA-binding NarL/FixJ family response regulator
MKRIFIVSGHPLFCQGIETLLRQADGLEIVGRETDADRAIECVKDLHPDIVIVDSDSLKQAPSPVMMQIWEQQFRTKIIGLSLQSNTICIYHEEQRVARGVDDLMRAIGDGLVVSE